MRSYPQLWVLSNQCRHDCFFWHWSLLNHSVNIQPLFVWVFFLFVLFFVIRKNEFIPIACQISITEKLAAQLLIARHGAGGHFAAGLFTGCAFEAQVDFPRKKAPSWPMGNQQVRSFCCASLLILNFVHKECSAHS